MEAKLHSHDDAVVGWKPNYTVMMILQLDGHQTAVKCSCHCRMDSKLHKHDDAVVGWEPKLHSHDDAVIDWKANYTVMLMLL